MKYSQILILLIGFFPLELLAASAVDHSDPVVSVIFWISLIFFFGVIGRYIAMRLHQPKVLGELLMGVVVGNICYFFGLQLAVILREGSAVFNIMREMLAGMSLNQAVTNTISNQYYASLIETALSSNQGIDLIKVAYVIDIFSRYGVIFLLFMAGLESSVTELKQTGRESLQVALLGVIAPIILGLLVSAVLMPSAPFGVLFFMAATLSATSVGISASVLKEMGKLKTREAKTILGAAMIDDVLGLIILAIVSSLIVSGMISILGVAKIIALACVFFTGVIAMGPWILRKAVIFFDFLPLWEAKFSIAFLFVMFLAWLATLVQLATIIGAFAAGVIIHDNFFAQRTDHIHKASLDIKELVAPIEALLAPLFFMLMGIQIKLESFFDWHVLLIACGLIIAAILGKLISGIAANSKDDRLLIGIGMMPRGEVGLVFASIGKTLGVISDELFSAIILMVAVTTFIAPLWLKARYARTSESKKGIKNAI